MPCVRRSPRFALLARKSATPALTRFRAPRAFHSGSEVERRAPANELAPDEREALERQAAALIASNDFPAALRRYETLRRSFPTTGRSTMSSWCSGRSSDATHLLASGGAHVADAALDTHRRQLRCRHRVRRGRRPRRQSTSSSPSNRIGPAAAPSPCCSRRSKSVGKTDSDGLARATVDGKPGKRFRVEHDCPNGHVAPSEPEVSEAAHLRPRRRVPFRGIEDHAADANLRSG